MDTLFIFNGAVRSTAVETVFINPHWLVLQIIFNLLDLMQADCLREVRDLVVRLHD